MFNKESLRQVTSTAGSIAKKIAESAVHAAIFAYVSKKVTNWMSQDEEKVKDKARIDDTEKSNNTPILTEKSDT